MKDIILYDIVVNSIQRFDIFKASYELESIIRNITEIKIKNEMIFFLSL
jgi:hypothetical protein